REIAATARGETPAPTPRITEFNPQVFAAQQHHPWAAILAASAQADAALRAALEECSEADLSDPGRFPWREGLPLWITAFVSGYEHPAEPYAQYFVETGHVAQASAVRQAAVETAGRFIGETEAYGYMIYNLGVFYAQTGQPGPAVATLRAALAGTPA